MPPPAPTTYLLDFSGRRVSADECAAAGCGGAISYISHPGWEKNWTRAEVDAYRAAGLAVGVVFETTSNRPNDGWEAGQFDARLALPQLADLGYPPDCTTWFACDTDLHPDFARDYYRAVHGELSRPWSPYGGHDICAMGMELGGAPAWQVRNYWRGGPAIAPGVGVVQEPNMAAPIPNTDINTTQMDNWGGWGAASAAPGKDTDMAPPIPFSLPPGYELEIPMPSTDGSAAADKVDAVYLTYSNSNDLVTGHVVEHLWGDSDARGVDVPAGRRSGPGLLPHTVETVHLVNDGTVFVGVLVEYRMFRR